MVYDIIMIYLFAGVAVTLEPLYRVARLLFAGDRESLIYRAHWQEIVVESHMPFLLAVFITVFIFTMQVLLRVLLWPVTVIALYYKYNHD